jgi:hypothetical protein
MPGRQRQVVLLGQRQLRGLLLQGLQLRTVGGYGLEVLKSGSCLKLLVQKQHLLNQVSALRRILDVLQDALAPCQDPRYRNTYVE